MNRGRPAKDEENPRRCTTSCRVSAEVLEYIRSVGTRVVEDTIRKTAAFKKWRDKNDQGD